MVRVQLQRFRIMVSASFQFTGFAIGKAQIILNIGIFRAQIGRFAQFRYCAVKLLAVDMFDSFLQTIIGIWRRVVRSGGKTGDDRNDATITASINELRMTNSFPHV